MTTAILYCSCGCYTPAHRNQLVLVRDTYSLAGVQMPARRSYHVLRACVAPFEAERTKRHILSRLVDAHRDASWWRRLATAPQIYDLTRDIHQRLNGAREAARRARQAVRLWLLPRWLGERLAWRVRGGAR